MGSNSQPIYPDCPKVLRSVALGGINRGGLLSRLRQHSVSLNAFAEQLLTDSRFPTSNGSSQWNTVQLQARSLGGGALLLAEIYERAASFGLSVCPLELAPHLRLQFPSEICDRRVTVSSDRLDESPEFPRGFYLEHREGRPWLRAYRASDDHVWDPEEWFVFGCDRTIADANRPSDSS